MKVRAETLIITHTLSYTHTETQRLKIIIKIIGQAIIRSLTHLHFISAFLCRSRFTVITFTQTHTVARDGEDVRTGPAAKTPPVKKKVKYSHYLQLFIG